MFRHIYILSFFLCCTRCPLLSQNEQKIVFELKDRDTHVDITWSTTDDTPFRQFNIYRSVDKENYYLVGEIPSHGKKTGSKYYHKEHTASGSYNYYRMVGIGADGNTRILQESSIEREDKAKAIDVYPKTEGGTVRLISAEQIFSMELEMTDLLGRKIPVQFVRESTHELTLVIGPIERGAYILTCYINGKRYVRKKNFFT